MVVGKDHGPFGVINSDSEAAEVLEQVKELKSNVVFIYVDDLRYMLDSDPHFEHAMPHLKKLASDDGILFANAQCPKPLCTPSRVSLLTGRRVAEHRFKSYTANFNGDYMTFPGVLHDKLGYESLAFGKIFDSQSFGQGSRNYNRQDICPSLVSKRKTCSFTESFGQDKICCSVARPFDNSTNDTTAGYSNIPHYTPCQHKDIDSVTLVNYEYQENEIYNDPLEPNYHKAGESPPIPYQKCRAFPNRRQHDREKNYLLYRGGRPIDFTDYGLADAAIKRIKHFAQNNKPFIVSIGFYRPHLPLSAPEETWSHFDNFSFTDDANENYWGDAFVDKLPNELNPGVNEASRYYSQAIGIEDPQFESGVREVQFYNQNKDGKLPSIRQGYYACARFIDRQIQRVVEELSSFNTQTRDNTHIVITSDHGFLLGEFGRLGKWVSTEAGTRVPLVIVPSRNLRKLLPSIQVGTTVNNPVDQIDIFPTVLEMTGIEYRTSDFLADPSRPPGFVPEDFLSGVSLTPFFTNPNTFTREISISEYESQFSLRSKYFRYIAFGDSSEKFLFDYRGGAHHRMVERENVYGKEGYENVSLYFDMLWKNVNSNNDRDSFKTVMHKIPFDSQFSEERGLNIEINSPAPTMGTLNPTSGPSYMQQTNSPTPTPTYNPTNAISSLAPTITTQPTFITTFNPSSAPSNVYALVPTIEPTKSPIEVEATLKRIEECGNVCIVEVVLIGLFVATLAALIVKVCVDICCFPTAVATETEAKSDEKTCLPNDDNPASQESLMSENQIQLA